MSQLKGDEEEFVDIQPIAPLEVNEVKGLKILIPSKQLTRLPVLLAQIKAGNNSYKLKCKIRQILYLLHQHKITKKQFNTVIIIMGGNKLVITTEPKLFILNCLKMLVLI